MTSQYDSGSSATDEELVIAWAIADEEARAARGRRERIEVDLIARMQAHSATSILHPFYVVKLETSSSSSALRSEL